MRGSYYYNESFEREVEGIRDARNKKEEERLLTERVLLDFVMCLAQEKNKDKLGFFVPRRKRSCYQNRDMVLFDHNNNLKKLEKKERKKAEKTGKVIKKKMVLSKVPVEEIELSVRFREGICNMGGTDIKLLVVKPLYKTDLSKHHNRLSVPINQVLQKFLKPEEELLLEEGSSGRSSCQGMDILFIEPSMQVCHEMCLKRWNMERTFSYMLSNEWNSVVERNKKVLQEKATVQLWSFRIDKQLGFQLIVQDDTCQVSDKRSCDIDQDFGATTTTTTTTTVEEHGNQQGFQPLVQDNICEVGNKSSRAISTTGEEDGSSSHGSSCLIQPAEPVPRL